MYIMCVDDLIFWQMNEDYICGLAIKSRDLGVDLDQKDNTARFWGLTLDLDENTIFL